MAHDDVGERGEHRPVMILELGHVQPRRGSRLDPGRELGAGCGQPARIHDPGTDGWLAALAGEPLELVGTYPATLCDHSIDRQVGAGACGRQHGIDVEHLAAPDGLCPAQVAHHEPVTRHQRQRLRELHPHQACLAGADAVTPQDVEADRPLAATDVGRERGTARHPMGHGRQDPE
jgi:hypothetical protein